MVTLRRARPDEADALSHIAKVAKAHWGYDQTQLKSWESELSYEPDYIRDHWVTVAEQGSEMDGDHRDSVSLLGVCALESFGDQLEIAGLWVLPDCMGQGIGKTLLRAALAHCREQRIKTLRLLSDPNAVGFYEATGAVLIGHERGSPNGRLLPLMHFNVDDVSL